MTHLVDQCPHPTLQAGIEAALAAGSAPPISLDHQPHPLAELWADAGRLADWLSRQVTPGDRVGVMARNGRLALLAWWAATRCGAIVVPYNTANTGDILRHQLADSDPALALVEPEFELAFRAAWQAAGLGARRLLVGTDLDDAIDAGSPDFTGHIGHPRDASHLIYTSGTTGPSKGCVISHSFIRNMALQVAANLERQPHETVWTAMPVFHLGAVTHVAGSILLGAPISLASRFSVSRFWDDVERSGAAIAGLMGSMLTLIAQAPPSDAAQRYHGRLRVASGSPVTPELAATWLDRFGVPRVGAGTYGMTEAALITATPPGRYRAGTAGTRNEFFDVRIADADGNAVPDGESGEILCRPRRPGIMFDGYWRAPEHTLAVWRDLWLHTGDYGRFDEQGYLVFTDRGKDYLRRGGENISSVEVERVLAAHGALAEVAVHAVPSPLGEDDLKVTAVRVPGATLDEATLYEWALPRLPRYAAPSYIEFRDALPKNEVGRILKYRLRADGVTPATWAAPGR